MRSRGGFRVWKLESGVESLLGVGFGGGGDLKQHRGHLSVVPRSPPQRLPMQRRSERGREREEGASEGARRGSGG
eukprot:2719066-Rhodomonas_salina.1